MTAAHRRHDMTEDVWERLKPHLPGGEGQRGRPAHDNRRFIDAVYWILRTGLLGAVCPRTTGTGRTLTGPPVKPGGLKASAAGGTRACGPGCWKR